MMIFKILGTLFVLTGLYLIAKVRPTPLPSCLE